MILGKIKKGLIQAIIVLVPTYIVAYLTDKMVYTIPMLAASGFIAASLTSQDENKLRVDQETNDVGQNDTSQDG
jgi:hypothetical protein